MLVLPQVIQHAQATACLAMLTTAMRQEPQQVVVDCSALTQFDSSALAVLIELRRASLHAQKTLQLQALPQRLAELAQVYGVLALFQPADAQAAASASPA
jgi:phospholipid transport system transporter-binding protein